MNSVTSSWRERRRAARAQRAIERALASSTGPAMQDDLLTLASSASFRSIPR
jgi:hypothetical protein